MAGPYETHEHDVLVVGAGGAGLRAAIEAAGQGASVALVCKSLLGKAHTVMAEGGVAAALANVEARDDWKVHFRDTMRGGKMLNHWRMAQLHAMEAPDRVRELEGWGAVFDRTTDGRILQRNFGGHTYPRLAHVGDRTGLEMIRTLQEKAVNSGAKVFMECTIYRLLVGDGRVAGAMGYWRESGKFVVFRAKAVVLATGGIGKAWRVTSNSWEYTGDGHAMAYEAGADLMDMEFVQFHPTGMVWPSSVKGTLVTEGIRGEGGVLKNAKGERFMFRYIPQANKGEYAETDEETRRWLQEARLKQEGKIEEVTARRPPELLTRDVVAKAITREIKEGRGSPHGGVFLDIATQRAAEEIKRKLPSMYHQFKELAGVDITAEAMEIGPTAHYHMGGVRVQAETQAATIPGLFAAGEAASGMHGANRLGGNSLSDLLVFGRRAGLFAAQSAKAMVGLPPYDDSQVDALAAEMLAPLERSEGENPFAVYADLQQVMEAYVGIIRNQSDLERGIAQLEKLKARAAGVKAPGTRHFNPGWHMALDLTSMLTVSQAVARAALERKESRGSQTREDFPDTLSEEGKTNVIVRKADGRMTVVREPLPQMPEELRALIGGN